MYDLTNNVPGLRR